MKQQHTERACMKAITNSLYRGNLIREIEAAERLLDVYYGRNPADTVSEDVATLNIYLDKAYGVLSSRLNGNVKI